jgi:hypothetical protein
MRVYPNCAQIIPSYSVSFRKKAATSPEQPIDIKLFYDYWPHSEGSAYYGSNAAHYGAMSCITVWAVPDGSMLREKPKPCHRAKQSLPDQQDRFPPVPWRRKPDTR